MGRAVFAYQAGAIDGEQHIEVLHRHIVNQLVITALQEGGVDRHHRLGAFAGHAGREGHGVLLGNRHIEVTQRETLAERHQVGAFLHRRGNTHQARVGGGHVAQPFAKHPGILRPAGLFRRGGGGIEGFEFGDRVVTNRVDFRRSEAFAFFGDDMQELRALEVAHVAQRGDQGGQVVAVDRADVVPAQLFEQRAGYQHALGIFFGATRNFPSARQTRQHFLAAFAHAGVGTAGEDLRQVIGQATHVARNRHVVVVEDHQHVGVHFRRMVQRFEGHAGGQRAITNHRNRLALTALQAGGNRHAQRCTDGGAGVADAKGVVLALGTAREGGQAVLLAQAGHALATAGEDFMRIRLVAHVPHQPVVRGVEHVMQGDGQLDHAQPGAKMPTGLADRVEQFQAQLIGQGFQLGFTQSTQAVRRGSTVEQGRGRAFAGNLLKRRGHQANRYRYRRGGSLPQAVQTAHAERRTWPICGANGRGCQWRRSTIYRARSRSGSAAASKRRRASRAWSRSSMAYALAACSPSNAG